MRAHWAVPPNQLRQTCTCIVTAYMENHDRRELQHLTVEDQLRARDRCRNGARSAGPGEAEAMGNPADRMIGDAMAGGKPAENASAPGK